MKTIGRRDFIGRAAVGAAALSEALAAPQAPAAAGAGAGFGVGFVGLGRRGMTLLETVHAMPGIRVSACCDIVGERLDAARRLVPDAFFTPHFGKVAFNSDVMVIALPDHLHRDACLTAFQYQRDVYLEIPVTHKLEEGAQLVQALAVTPSTIVQSGHQQVSSPINAKIKELIQAGEIGEVRAIRGAVTVSAERAGQAPVPEKFGLRDSYWQFFLGEAPRRPLDVRRLLQWRLYWDYSTGLAGSELAAMISLIQALTGAEAPDKVTGRARILRKEPSRETPDSVSAILEYPQGFVATLSVSTGSADRQSLLVIEGEKGTIDYESNSCRLCRDGKPPVEFKSEGDATVLHVAAFLKAVKERSRPAADLSFGLTVAKVVHLINLSSSQGKTLDGASEG